MVARLFRSTPFWFGVAFVLVAAAFMAFGLATIGAGLAAAGLLLALVGVFASARPPREAPRRSWTEESKVIDLSEPASKRNVIDLDA